MSNEVLGRTVNGDINRTYRSTVEQWGGEKFIELLDAAFNADPRLSGIRWTQYTPYFNDGDACEFSAYLSEEAVASFDGIVEDWPYEAGEDGEEFTEGEPFVLSLTEAQTGKRSRYTYNPNSTGWEDRYIHSEEDVYKSPAGEALTELARAFGHFEDFLQDSFGDHAQVVATPGAFNVEYYEHD